MYPLLDNRRYLIPFRSALLPQIFTDVLVIGSGVAGLSAALAAASNADVIMTAKGSLEQSNTYLAQGGIAAVIGAGTDPSPPAPTPTAPDPADHDSLDLHVADTLKAGAGLCNEQVVRAVIDAAPACIDQLVAWGMRFDRADPDGHRGLAMGREGGHSMARVLHAAGDATGKELVRTLDQQARACERIRRFDHCFALDLLTLDGPADRVTAAGALDQPINAGRCVGAITHHPRYGLQVIWAGATVLACGGCGQVFRESTNPPTATGDGLAMAYRAGAKLADMAFMQFHPTTLYIAGAARSLISEAVRGEGALLVDRSGYRFMPDYDPRAELAPRDVVSRSILAQLAKTHFTHVYLDCRPIGTDRFAKRFPGIFALLKRFGLDPGKDLVPVHPSAHYMVGGVHTDTEARTNLAGLYACGEVACTGLHGANRLASNSLLEGLVFGRRAGQVCLEMLNPNRSEGQAGDRPAKIVSDIRPSDRSELDLDDVRSSLRSVMWRHVGIERSGDRLAEVAEMFDFWARYTLDKIFDDSHGWEVQNLLLAGALITRAAVWRTESRGTHYRVDHPQPEDTFRCHDLWRRGAPKPDTLPIEQRAPAPAT